MQYLRISRNIFKNNFIFYFLRFSDYDQLVNNNISLGKR